MNDQNNFDSCHLLVPKGCHLVGAGFSDEGLSLRIDGSYSGELALGRGGRVLIGEEAVVACTTFVADDVLIAGDFTGAVTARRCLELLPTAKVSGVVRYERDLMVHAGAYLSAQLQGPSIGLV